MSDELLKAFNAAADAAHIAALVTCEAINRANECAKALHKGTGFDRAGYSIETAKRASVELLDETADIGLVGHDTPRSRGVELPKKTIDEKLQDFLDAPTIKTPWGVMTNARYGLDTPMQEFKTTQAPLLIYTWLKSNTVLTRPRDYIGTEDTVHPDAAAFSVEGARSIINECRGSDLYLSRQDIIECEYMGTDSNGSIRFKRLRIIETY